MKIDIGCGYKRNPGFLRVDSDHNCAPDFLVDFEKDPLPFPNSSVEYVLAEHILEHIGEGYFHLLQEIYRVCKHGAIFDIKVPHHFHETFINDPTHRRPITVEGMRLFSKKVNLHEIKTGGRSSTLGIMYDVDFDLIDFSFVHDPYYDELKKTLPHPALERLFREANNTTLETQIKLMVIKDHE